MGDAPKISPYLPAFYSLVYLWVYLAALDYLAVRAGKLQRPLPGFLAYWTLTAFVAVLVLHWIYRRSSRRLFYSSLAWLIVAMLAWVISTW